MTRSLCVALACAVASGAGAVEVELNPGDPVGSLTEQLGPGDEFVFNDGVYELDEPLYWIGTGTEDAPIVLKAAPAATPILRLVDGWTVARIEDSAYIEVRGLVFEGGDPLFDEAGFDGLQIGDSSNIHVEDVEIRHISADGLYIFGNTSALTVHRVHIHDIADGYGFWAGCWDASCWTQDSVFDTLWIHDVRGENDRGMQLAPGAQGNTVTNNVIYAVNGYGLVVGRTELGPQNVVEGNVVWSASGVGMYVGGAALVRNNVIFNVDGEGLYLDRDGDLPPNDVVVTHNTVVNTTEFGVVVDDWQDGEGLVLANNVVSNPVGRAFYVEEDEITLEATTIVGNVFTGLVEGLDPLLGHFAPGAGNADFADAETWDFYPSANSTLVNAADPSGTSFVPEVDFNGFPRDGAAPEVGAYEYFGGGNPGWTVREGFKEQVDNRPDVSADVGGCCAGGDERDTAGVFLFPLLAVWLGASRRRR